MYTLDEKERPQTYDDQQHGRFAHRSVASQRRDEKDDRSSDDQNDGRRNELALEKVPKFVEIGQDDGTSYQDAQSGDLLWKIANMMEGGGVGAISVLLCATCFA